ncbi:MAG: undecaprenyl/decaprenyl-phosphate alpha-N-acetylglucosaminyl 1-phosphate transferase [Verrucomicrobiales bacterium]|nr:undecaprenyl/decaprenyl-phosphate alpha-N-acetylglucosaminyl 1-phosphate transferase [Verrucomicrobiales bacterium]MCP5560742.1 undecaprenyl/decaprenyl-phosphate alpha-N-acetylglucosaminyl 1-phosphate transferase [Verrucomicrobiaceae bacterium]
MWELNTILILFFGALTMAAAGTYLILRFQDRLTFGMDSPDTFRKQHDRPVCRLGGLPIFVTLCVGFLALAIRSPEFTQSWMPIIVTNAIVFSVGFLDDLHPLGARVKLIGQIGAALILYSMGVSIDMLSNPFGEGAIHLGWWGLPITLLWLIAIPNIVNLIDGMDGLATGFGMFLCGTLAFVGHFSLRPDVVLVATVMAGALGGFLIFNFPPAKIFLGDGGAYLIGFFVASVSVNSSNKGSIIAALLVIIIALGVPILDTAFAIIRRAVRGVPIFRADAEHVHHKLIVLGYSKGQALIALYLVSLVLCVAGISVLITKGLALPVAGAVCFLIAVGAARYLGYIRSWSTLRAQWNEALQRRKNRQYVTHHGELLELEVDRCDSVDEFATLLLHTIKRLGLSITPKPGWVEADITLLDQGRCRLYRQGGHDDRGEWQWRVESLANAINAARLRWDDIPGLEIVATRPDTTEAIPA